MIVIPPVKITDTNLTSSTIAEPSNGEVVWSASTNYVAGQVVIRTQTHRKYESVSGGTDSGLPENTPTKWLDVGPTNKWAMFDQKRNIATYSPVGSTGTMTIVVTPGKRFDALALTGVQAKTVTVTVESGGTTVFGPTTYNMNGRNTTTWSQYFFGVFIYKKTLVIQNLPPYSGAKITVKFDNDAGQVACGGFIVGTKIYLGATQYNAKSDSLNFSKVDRDDFGNSELIPRRTVPRTQQSLWCEKTNVNVVRQVRSDLNAVPAFWSGLDDQYSDPYFEAIAIFGFYKQFEIDIGHPSVATINLELEEL